MPARPLVDAGVPAAPVTRSAGLAMSQGKSEFPTERKAHLRLRLSGCHRLTTGLSGLTAGARKLRKVATSNDRQVLPDVVVVGDARVHPGVVDHPDGPLRLEAAVEASRHRKRPAVYRLVLHRVGDDPEKRRDERVGGDEI